MDEKVSVIMPVYNSEKYISQAIASVIKQTYQNWELIIVDDCSTDRTCEIIEEISNSDSRVRLFRMKENAGAGRARTHATHISCGRFIAYLDADDIWATDKLEKQVSFMLKHKCGFSCTSYEVIADDGRKLNKFIYMLPRVNYVGFLTNNLLQTVGIMVDTDIVDKKCLVMPDIRRRQDAATWLQILKAGHDCYGINEILAQYRRTENSLSSNKFKAIKGVWFLYREIEKLSLSFSCYCFIRYAFLAVWKRIYVGGMHK